jgi:hypothetical protein
MQASITELVHFSEVASGEDGGMYATQHVSGTSWQETSAF